MGLLLIADSCRLIAMSPAELRCRLVHGTNAWKKLDFEWKEAEWWTSARDSLEAKIEVDDTVITRTTREQSFQALDAWFTFDGNFVKELAEREVIAWRSFYVIQKLLCDKKSGIATSTALVVILRHSIRVLVLLDTDSDTMHPPARNPRQDAKTNENVPRYSTETPEAHIIAKSYMVLKCTLQATSRGAAMRRG